MPDYILLPKYRYPIAIEDCYSTYTWVLQNAESLKINKEKILVTGDSAGGNIAAAVTAMLHDRGQPLPKGAMLIYPVLEPDILALHLLEGAGLCRAASQLPQRQYFLRHCLRLRGFFLC